MLHRCSGSGEAAVSFRAGAPEESIYFYPWKQRKCAARWGQADSSRNEYIGWEWHAQSPGLPVPFPLCRTKDLNTISALSMVILRGDYNTFGAVRFIAFLFLLQLLHNLKTVKDSGATARLNHRPSNQLWFMVWLQALKFPSFHPISPVRRF